VDIASVDGLEGLSIGRLANDLDVSKSGLFAHFGSKQVLQLETIDAAGEIFEQQVWQPVAELAPGLPQLSALMESWIDYLERDVFAGGCFFSNVYHEYDSRPGPVHDRVAAQKRRWTRAMVWQIREGQQRGEIRAEIDPEQLAFELDAVGLLTNSRWQLDRDDSAFSRARTAIRDRLTAAATDAGQAVLTSRS
jgi:AcrR family transcriptional regulator